MMLAGNIEVYSFSFTAASLRLQNFLRLATLMADSESIEYKALLINKDLIGAVTEAGTKRELQELYKRHQALSTGQKELLIKGSLEDKRQLAFLAICKAYSFIRDFVLEVVRERVLVFDFQLADSDFNSFVRKKSELHPELDEFAFSTVTKAKQRLWKILEECGVINSVQDKRIRQMWLSENLVKEIILENSNYLKFYLISDPDIKKIIEKYGKGGYSREV